MGKVFNRDLSRVHARSFSDAAVSPRQPSYPVVILRAGGGALTTDFTSVAEDLASHGYIVTGFDAPYRTGVVVYPDGRVVERPASANPETLPPAAQPALINRLLPMWVSDTAFVVDQVARLNAADARFAGRLDLRRLGVVGHSFGGATALQFCHDDRRCTAAIDLDGAPYGSVIQEGLSQPTLFLLSDHGNGSAPEDREVAADIHSIYQRLTAGKLLLMIRGANHFSFSDQMLTKSHYLVRAVRLFSGGLEPRRGLSITRAYVHTFFDVYLKGEPAGALDELRRSYPEIRPFAP